MSYEAWRISYQSSEQAARAAYASIAAIEAENAALKARLAGGVEVSLCLYAEDGAGWYRAELHIIEYTALLPLDSKRVLVIDNAREGKE